MRKAFYSGLAAHPFVDACQDLVDRSVEGIFRSFRASLELDAIRQPSGTASGSLAISTKLSKYVDIKFCSGTLKGVKQWLESDQASKYCMPPEKIMELWSKALQALESRGASEKISTEGLGNNGAESSTLLASANSEILTFFIDVNRRMGLLAFILSHVDGTEEAFGSSHMVKASVVQAIWALPLVASRLQSAAVKSEECPEKLACVKAVLHPGFGAAMQFIDDLSNLTEPIIVAVLKDTAKDLEGFAKGVKVPKVGHMVSATVYASDTAKRDILKYVIADELSAQTLVLNTGIKYWKQSESVEYGGQAAE